VLDLGRVAYHARQQPHDLALILQDQQVEGALVPTLNTGYQFGIDIAFAHGLSLERARPGMASCLATQTQSSRQSCADMANFQQVTSLGPDPGRAGSRKRKLSHA